MIPCAIMKVGVVGLGAIGRQLCRALDDGIVGLHLAGATARDREKAERFLKSLGSPAAFLSLDELVGASDLVIEASTQAHLRDEIAPRTLGAGKDLVVLSCGGLIRGRGWDGTRGPPGGPVRLPSPARARLRR